MRAPIIFFCLLSSCTSQTEENLPPMQCTEVRTCDGTSVCKQSGSNQLSVEWSKKPNSAQYLIGTKLRNDTDRSVFKREVTFVLGGVPRPSSSLGRQTMVTFDSDAKIWVSEFLPAKEKQGFESSDWVRVDYQCKKVEL